MMGRNKRQMMDLLAREVDRTIQDCGSGMQNENFLYVASEGKENLGGSYNIRPAAGLTSFIPVTNVSCSRFKGNRCA